METKFNKTLEGIKWTPLLVKSFIALSPLIFSQCASTNNKASNLLKNPESVESSLSKDNNNIDCPKAISEPTPEEIQKNMSLGEHYPELKDLGFEKLFTIDDPETFFTKALEISKKGEILLNETNNGANTGPLDKQLIFQINNFRVTITKLQEDLVQNTSINELEFQIVYFTDDKEYAPQQLFGRNEDNAKIIAKHYIRLHSYHEEYNNDNSKIIPPKICTAIAKLDEQNNIKKQFSICREPENKKIIRYSVTHGAPEMIDINWRETFTESYSDQNKDGQLDHYSISNPGTLRWTDCLKTEDNSQWIFEKIRK